MLSYCARGFSTIAATALVMSSGALAAAPVPLYDVHFAGGSLDDGLATIGRITGAELLYSNAVVRGHRAEALNGRFSAEQAIAIMLGGTNIHVKRAGSNIFVLTASARSAPPAQSHSKTPRRPLLAKSLPATSEAEAAEIVVTGSHIRGQSSSASPLIVLDRADINRSGHATVGQLLADLPQNFGGTATESTLLAAADRSSANDGAASSVNLRGLGSNATLTLIDGRRAAGSGGNGDFTDLSQIPMIAVERIEILPDGASALYGSDAVGGVVNIRLRKSLEGAETQLRAGSVTSGSLRETDIAQVVGHHWSSGHVLLAYEYYHRDPLPSADRRFARSADLRTLGGADFRSYYSSPGTLLSYNPALGNYAPAYAIPDGQDGTSLKPTDFRSGGNLENQQAGTDLLPRQTRHSGYGTIEQQIGQGIKLYAEGRFTVRDFNYNSPAATDLLTVTSANPYFVSPTGASSDLIAYSFLRELGPVRNPGSVKSFQGTTGATLSLFGDWQIDSFVSHAEERTHDRSTHLVNSARLDEALGNRVIPAGSDYNPQRDGYFNPFGSGSSNSAAILDSIGSGYIDGRIHSQLTTIESKADGSLIDLPGGPVRLAIGGSWRREALLNSGESFLTEDMPVPSLSARGARSILSAYAELAVPIFGPRNARPALRRLDLSLALRHEHHSDYGDTTNPKLGLMWQPTSELTVRGSFGTSFRAPALPEIDRPFRVSATQLPNSAGGYTPVLFLTGGNPALKPERATSYSAGWTWASRRWPGFQWEGNVFRTRFRDRIGQPAYEQLLVALTDPELAPFVTAVNPATNANDLARVQALMASPGAIVPAGIPPQFFQAIVDSRFVNTSEVTVSGFDLSAQGRFRLGRGQLTPRASMTYLLEWKERITPAGQMIERTDTVGYPASLRAQASLDWSMPSWGLTATVHHVGGYRDTLASPSRPVRSWTTLDIQGRWTPNGTHGVAKGLTVALNIQNAADTTPPFVSRATPLGYDPANADALGRFVSLQISKSW